MAVKKHFVGNKMSTADKVGLGVLFGVGLTLLLIILLQDVDVALFNPQGYIANEQHWLMVFSVSIMLVIAVPTLALLYYIAWKYRESNPTATYDSHAKHGKVFVFSVWTVPTVFMLILASVMWPATHKLEPQKTIAADVEPVKIQVIALRWKWLFIYPEQRIATVNFAQIPVNTPVQFELTADEAPMNSFWVPHLSGQLYAMTGHLNRLNMVANNTGDFPGTAAEISGEGFAGMKFMVRSSSSHDFDTWVDSVKQADDMLTQEEYAELLKPSEYVPQKHYAWYDTNIYDNLLIKYNAFDHWHIGRERAEKE